MMIKGRTIGQEVTNHLKRIEDNMSLNFLRRYI